MDILAANRLGRALYSQHFDSPHGPPNSARFIFLDLRAPSFYVDWERVATDAVAVLRAEAGRDPYDKELSDLVGELSTRSELFRTRWAAHNVRKHDTGTKRFDHPLVGELELSFETMDAGRRLRAAAVRLHRRGGHPVGRGAGSARELVGDAACRRSIGPQPHLRAARPCALLQTPLRWRSAEWFREIALQRRRDQLHDALGRQ